MQKLERLERLKEARTANIGLAKAGLTCFYDTFVLKIPAFSNLQNEETDRSNMRE